MKWTEILNSSPDTALTFPGEKFTYGKLSQVVEEIMVSSPYPWTAEWTINSIAGLLKALDLGYSIYVVQPHLKAPEINGDGWILLPSSGTEGPSRYYAHAHTTLQSFTPLYRSKKAGAVLKAGHAAGIEFFLSGIIGANELSLFNSAEHLQSWTGENFHGPPSFLGYLLNFHEKYSSFLRSMKCFYSGTENLLPHYVEVKKRIGLNFSIEQVYGTTETWSIRTETHPNKPWLLKITDPCVSIIDEKIGVSSSRVASWSEFERNKIQRPYLLKDKLIPEEDGWFRIESERSWVQTLLGEKVNLFDLENNILQAEGVLEVETKAYQTPLGSYIAISIYPNVPISKITPWLIGPIEIYRISFHPESRPTFAKKKRK